MAMNDMDPNHLQLILQDLEAGDSIAATKLYRHYFDQIYRFSRTLVRSEDSAHDVAQETFMSLLRKPISFEGRSKFSSYLCAIAKNKARDLARKEAAMPNDAGFDEQDGGATQADESRSSNPEFVVGDLLTDANYRKCLDKLPDAQKEVLAMTFSLSLTEAEVASEVGCAVGTVKSRLSTAREYMRKCLARWHREVGHA